MILVKVELHSAQTGKVTEIGRLQIANDRSGSKERGNYLVWIFRRGSKARVQRQAQLLDFPRLSAPIWKLLRRALEAAGY